MTNGKSISTLLFISLFSLLILSNLTNANSVTLTSEDLSELKSFRGDTSLTKMAKSPVYPSLTPQALTSISVTKDSDLSTFPGSGTVLDPYRIENKADVSISIGNTRSYFVVQNVRTTASISMYNVSNAIVRNVTTSGFSLTMGISNTLIENNTISAGYDALTLNGGLNTIINNNSFSLPIIGASSGIKVDASKNIIISNNSINGAIGINIGSNSENITIADNQIQNASRNGIQMGPLFSSIVSITNITLKSNNISNSGYSGVWIGYVSNVTLIGNYIKDSVQASLSLYSSSNVTLLTNKFVNGTFLFDMSSLKNFKLFGNTMDGFPMVFLNNANNSIINTQNSFLFIVNSTNILVKNSIQSIIKFYSSQNITIINNLQIDSLEVYNSKNLTVTQNVFSSIGDVIIQGTSHGFISNNTFSTGKATSIFLQDGDTFTLSHNSFQGGLSGTSLNNVSSSTIKGNLYKNFASTALVVQSSTNNTIADNSFFNTSTGISLTHTTTNLISNNSLNLFGTGISLSTSGKNNITKNNLQNSNNDGIYLYASDGVRVLKNTISKTSTGINEFGSKNLLIQQNHIKDSTLYGLFLYSVSVSQVKENTITSSKLYAIKLGSSSYLNEISSNNFLGNNVGGTQAIDDGTENHFIGNYWSDWISPDANHDRIVDSPYIIDGTAKSNDSSPSVYFIPTYDYQAPVITAAQSSINMTEGDNTKAVIWTIGDKHPATFLIIIDGVISGNRTWTNTTVQFFLSGEMPGFHNYTIVVWDEFGNFASNTVFVTINAKPTPVSSIATTSVTPTPTPPLTSPGSPIPLPNLWVIISGMISIALIIRIKKHRIK